VTLLRPAPSKNGILADKVEKMIMKKLVMAWLAVVAVSCAPAVTATRTETPIPTTSLTSIPPTSSIPPAPIPEQPSPASYLSRYAFPKSISPTGKYLFYLHGGIIEEQGIPAVSPDYGEYEYQEILEKLGSYGFVVISEQRANNTDEMEYAGRISDQVTTLLNVAVPAANITVVGASKGAAIAVYVSHFLANPEVKFVLLGICHPDMVQGFMENNLFLYGRVLSIYDTADREYGGSCEEFFSFSEHNGGLTRHDEIVLHLGTGHGILYKPLDEWILPIVQWAGRP
jgi:hypothetical protein